jgi:predicted dehydrogenase
VTERLRVGVIGVGAVAQVAHLPILAGRDDIEIVGVSDIDEAKARALAARFNVSNTFYDIEELLKVAQPDAVVVCTPNHLHEVHTLTALSAGVAVLCERPLAVGAAGVERVVAAQQRADRPVMVGLNHRYRSDVQAVHSFISGGELGRLRGMRAGWYQFRPSRADFGWRQRGAEAGGGAMLDLGLALLDVGLWLADGPIPVQVLASLHRPEGEPMEDAGCALVICEGGYSILVDAAWRYVGEAERLWGEVLGERGTARVAPLKIFKEMHGQPVNVTPTGASGRENIFSQSYRAEWATFVAVARREVDPPPLGDQLVLHRTIDAIYRSAEEGRAVAV